VIQGSPELIRRMRWVMLFLLVAFGALVVRLWQLQVLRGDRYYHETVENVVHERDLPSIRGRILDRNGAPLADNRPAFNIYATPRSFTPVVAAELRRLLGLSDEEMEKVTTRMDAGRKRSSRQPVLILEDQIRERAARVEQERFRLPDIEVRHEPYRDYPQGDLAAHVIGYMSQATPAEVEGTSGVRYEADELVGRYGLEFMMENYLRGKKGKASSRAIASSSRSPATASCSRSTRSCRRSPSARSRRTRPPPSPSSRSRPAACSRWCRSRRSIPTS
jgi:penicillin-binding protein 2